MNFLSSCDHLHCIRALLWNVWDNLKKRLKQMKNLECEFGFFQQNGGTEMGGLLSRLLADLVIENKIEAKNAVHPKMGVSGIRFG